MAFLASNLKRRQLVICLDVNVSTAIKEEPLNHSLWNKYGAACAQLLKTEESIRAYKLAIDLRPNYVRTIVNLGLSHNNQANF